MFPFGGHGDGGFFPMTMNSMALITNDMKLCFLVLAVFVLGEATSGPENSSGSISAMCSRPTDLMGTQGKGDCLGMVKTSSCISFLGTRGHGILRSY